MSVSIDQTLRLWDITGLKMKHTASSLSSKEETNSGLPEILSKTDYSVESKEAHNSEINWCCFHPDPSKQLCLSAADDNYVRIWKIDSRNGVKEVETLRGHYNNVNSAVIHPQRDIVISAFEDRSLRIYDLDKNVGLFTHRREADRFWAIVAHQKENLFAAGRDTGLMIFKPEKERPIFTVAKDYILFIKGKHIYRYNMRTREGRVLVTLKPKTDVTHYYHNIHCYSYEEDQPNKVLVSTRSTNYGKDIVDLYKIGRGTGLGPVEPIRTPAKNGIFIGANRYAVCDGTTAKLMVDGTEKRFKYTIWAREIYDAGAGRLFTKNHEYDSPVTELTLWDVEKCAEIGMIPKCDFKHVVISDNRQHIAYFSSNKITICDGQLNVLTTIVEQRKVKSAAWDDGGVLLYSTPVHVKYALTDGETTTIVSVQETLYIMAVRNDRVFCINRNSDIKQIAIDPREFKFKQAVVRNDRGAILASLRQLGSLTRAEISFLVKKGHPGLALKFVKDVQTRFPLALQAYDIDEALDAAEQIDDKGCWEQLAKIGTQIGHVRAVERAYIKLRQAYKLAMLYLVCGQRDKMAEARGLAHELGDTSSEFVISLLMKDFAECTRIIRRCGHANLAYTCAVNHGLHDLALEISQELDEKQLRNLPALDQTTVSLS